MFGATKVTQFQNSRCRVQKQVLWFDVAVTYPKRMNISQTSKQLIHVQFNVTDWDSLLVFTIMTRNFVHGLRNILQHQIQINLILLQILTKKIISQFPHNQFKTVNLIYLIESTYLFTTGVKKEFELHYVTMF